MPINGGIAGGAISTINAGDFSTGGSAIGGAGLGAGLSLVGDIVSAVSQGHQNKMARQFALDMYNRQRADSLSDWAMQNDYNSPVKLMARYRDAGLNPNLIYGNGTNAEASMPRASSAPAYSPHPLDLKGLGSGVGNAVSQIYDIKLKEAQTDNVRAATTNTIEDNALKKTQEVATLKGAGYTDAETTKLLTEMPNVKSLSDISVDAAKANVGKTLAETGDILTRQELAVASTAMSIKEAAARILHMRYENETNIQTKNEIMSRIKNIDADTSIKNADLALKKEGIQPHDALWQRKLAQVLGKTGDIGKYSKSLPPAVNPFDFGNLW